MIRTLTVLAAALMAPTAAFGFIINLSSDDFSVTPAFSTVSQFSFTISVDEPLMAGEVYSNPTIEAIHYEVSGSLVRGTPSGFAGFALDRDITGVEFYSQGSSLEFEVSATADLSDGVQVSELVGTDDVFVFNGREVGNGRFHPALFALNSDGTGSIRNSNNVITPGSDPIDFGAEYISNLSFNPTTLSITPTPGSLPLLAVSVATMGWIRRRTA